MESRKQAAVERIDCLNQLQAYPPRSRLDPEAWLNNFKPPEIPYALALIRGLIFFNTANLERLFAGSVARLMVHVVSEGATPDVQLQEWNTFFHSALFTRIPGELPSEGDSGFIFLRLIRDLFKIPQNHLVSPQEAFNSALNSSDTNIIFVDDFIGSGDQMRENLNSPYGSGSMTTFKELAAGSAKRRFFCCTAISSEKGAQLLERECPSLELVSQHRINDRYNARSPDFFVSHGLHDFAQKIEDISVRAGIAREATWGYGDLGLTIAFDHGIPDSTIPLLSHQTDGWIPLIKAH